MEIVHADEHLVVVDKPSGLLSVPGRGADKQDCAAARVQARYADALVVHRLDMSTSGLLLFGRGAAMQRALNVAFASREVRKRYIAVVAGLVESDQGQIDVPLIADWPNRPRQIVDIERGKPSLTRWRVLERDAANACTRVELEPVTGRSHQLRVHLAHIGHAILGDDLYGDAAAAPRLLLHASELALAHPFEARPLHFSSPVPF